MVQLISIEEKNKVWEGRETERERDFKKSIKKRNILHKVNKHYWLLIKNEIGKSIENHFFNAEKSPIKLVFYGQQKYNLKLRQNKNDLYNQGLRHLPPVDMHWETVGGFFLGT